MNVIKSIRNFIVKNKKTNKQLISEDEFFDIIDKDEFSCMLSKLNFIEFKYVIDTDSIQPDLIVNRILIHKLNSNCKCSLESYAIWFKRVFKNSYVICTEASIATNTIMTLLDCVNYEIDNKICQYNNDKERYYKIRLKYCLRRHGFKTAKDIKKHKLIKEYNRLINKYD